MKRQRNEYINLRIQWRAVISLQ